MQADTLLALTSAVAIVASSPVSEAGIVADRSPFALTVDELFAWTPDGSTTDRRNVARTQLAARFVTAPIVSGVRRPDPNVRVLYAPDGMNNLGNYLEPQRRFNLFSFTHWSQIDVLAWFGGTAERTVNLPARPWVEAAHRNGVKVIGAVFFAPAAWGGSPATAARFLRRDRAGRFPAATQLVRIARYYGFDGWLVNAETDLPGASAVAMIDFMAELRRVAPAAMEIHWYDAMLPDGRVVWQNALTRANARFLQDGPRRTADAMFLNYAWTRDGLRSSAALAERSGRSRYDLFIGADLWPQRDGAQAAFRNTHWLEGMRGDDGRALGSIALFAANFGYNFPGDARTPWFSRFDSDPGDVARFQDAEARLFTGDTRNLTTLAKAGSWPGVGALAPTYGLAVDLPFRTSFNVGYGLKQVGERVAPSGPWHDMSRQDILPTWQFAVTGRRSLKVGYDFARVHDGGASLRIEPGAGRRTAVVPLYSLRTAASEGIGVIATSLTRSGGYAIRLSAPGRVGRDMVVVPATGWHTQRWCAATPAGSLIVAVVARAGARAPLNLGGLTITDGCGQGVPKQD